MPTPLKSTYDLRSVPDGSPPIRPSLSEVGGGAKVQSLAAPPDPANMITAPDVNQWQRLIVAAHQVTANARLTVRLTAGAPVLYRVAAQSTLVTLAALTFTVTNPATGTTVIAWAAGTFPEAIADAVANLTGATAGFAVADSTTTPNQVTVYTKDTAGTATNLPFVLDIF
jgi:hypothetical protein